MVRGEENSGEIVAIFNFRKTNGAGKTQKARQRTADIFSAGGDYRHPNIYTCKSAIHGRGCFAKKKLSKNTVAFVFGGTVFIQDLKKLKNKEYRDRERFYRSVIHLTDDFYLKFQGSDRPDLRAQWNDGAYDCQIGKPENPYKIIRIYRSYLKLHGFDRLDSRSQRNDGVGHA